VVHIGGGVDTLLGLGVREATLYLILLIVHMYIVQL